MSLEYILDHPQKLYPIILVLVILLVILYMKKIGEKKAEMAGPGYLGSTLHQSSMAETIEDVTRKVLLAYPSLDDSEHARMIRDELRLRGFKTVDMYEGTIYATITRLKGGAAG